MHYDISYANATPEERRTRSLSDIRQYMGDERYTTVTDLFRQLPSPPTLQMFRLQMSFAGVQGVPVAEYYGHLWGDEALRTQLAEEDSRPTTDMPLIA